MSPRVLVAHRRRLGPVCGAAGLLAEPAAVVEVGISAATTFDDAVAGAFHLQESVRDDAATKAALFAHIDRCALPDAIIASSTSAIPGSAFMEHVAGRRRCLVAHPVNPPYLIPRVEICPSPWTDPGMKDECYAFMTRLGQTPIRMNREIAGFIRNRLQFVLVSEALHLVGKGYRSIDDVDKVLTAGLARRWAFIGPFEVAHLSSTEGYSGFVHALGGMIRTLAKGAKLDYE